MSRLTRHWWALVLLFLCQATLAADRPPNVILILTDDQGYADLGCYDGTRMRTPRIDQMAAEGARFTDFYACANVCTPSRAGMLTGCYPQRISMGEIPQVEGGKPWQTRVLYPGAMFGLNPNEQTIARLLKARGYATGLIGKWHLGDKTPFLPRDHGFDTFFGTLYTNDTPGNDLVRATPTGIDTIEKDPDQNLFTSKLTAESIQFIESSKDKPFFLFLSHIMPHVPIHASEKFRGKSPGGLYGDVIEELDDSTGQILDCLNRLRLSENTLVIYTSDNGPWLAKGEHGGLATPLKGGKGGSHEGGQRVPCIMRWPGKIPPGKVSHELAVNFDFLPTIAKLAGATLPTDRTIDGKDIFPLATQPDAKSPHDRFYYYNGNKIHGVRSGQWKLKIPTTLNEEFGGYQKLENPTTLLPRALYNLANDVAEQKNVIADHKEVADKLQAMIEEARADLGDSRRDLVGKNVRPIGKIDR